MRHQARALADVMLERHRAVREALGGHAHDNLDDDDIAGSVVSYGDLCERARLGRAFARACYPFLYEVAQWCEEHGWPRLNALAVNARKGSPGEGYSKAPGCGDWDTDVRRVIAFSGHPARAGQA